MSEPDEIEEMGRELLRGQYGRDIEDLLFRIMQDSPDILERFQNIESEQEADRADMEEAQKVKRENALLAAQAAKTVKDAAEAMLAAFPGLTPTEMKAGLMHSRGATWKEMMDSCSITKSTLKHALDLYYKKTNQIRPERQRGRGKKLRFDERMDSPKIVPEQNEQLE